MTSVHGTQTARTNTQEMCDKHLYIYDWEGSHKEWKNMGGAMRRVDLTPFKKIYVNCWNADVELLCLKYKRVMESIMPPEFWFKSQEEKATHPVIVSFGDLLEMEIEALSLDRRAGLKEVMH